VGAGLPYRELSDTLAKQGQFLPLDPPFHDTATIGGVVAANTSGPRRRRYGTARDMVIGMTFATVAGKLVKSGGMVVKNVTGLDMAKLMIGSFGTLGAATSINFKVFPRPAEERTFLARSTTPGPLILLRNAILRSQLQPVAMDLLNPPAAKLLGLDGTHYCLALESNGNHALVLRYERDWGELAQRHGVSDFDALDQAAATSVWKQIRDFPSLALAGDSTASIVYVSCQPKKLADLIATVDTNGAAAILARAAAGIAFVVCPDVDAARLCLSTCRAKGLPAVVAHCPAPQKGSLELWADPGEELTVMQRIKHSLDPAGMLNPGRLFNRI
ncbi:MAG: FAD-binding oxidoreductase, partial [Acidobacteria bacterium]|nr:FAD-binding oxidoreductase [Acidobacteriota bacterium]